MCRAALERRYQLLPYMLTLAHEATLSGAPIIRPLAWIAPTHAESLACDDQFLLGDALLAAPVLDEGATSREILLPPGEWFAWESGELHTGDQHLTIPVTLDTLPLYVRAGTILPLAGVAQSTDSMTDQPLTLHVIFHQPTQQQQLICGWRRSYPGGAARRVRDVADTGSVARRQNYRSIEPRGWSASVALPWLFLDATSARWMGRRAV